MLIRELTHGARSKNSSCWMLLIPPTITSSSTQTRAELGLPKPGSQTAGRGRGSRRWLSSRDQGLYISFLAYPNWSARLSRILNIVGVLAVIESLRSLLPPELPGGGQVAQRRSARQEKGGRDSGGAEHSWSGDQVGHRGNRNQRLSKPSFPASNRFRLPLLHLFDSRGFEWTAWKSSQNRLWGGLLISFGALKRGRCLSWSCVLPENSPLPKSR